MKVSLLALLALFFIVVGMAWLYTRDSTDVLAGLGLVVVGSALLVRDALVQVFERMGGRED